MRPVASPPGRRSILIGFGATLVAGLALLAAASVAIGAIVGDRIHGGVGVGGVSLAGLDRATAAERIEAGLPSLSEGQALLIAGPADQEVSFADLGRGYDVDAMVDAAFGVGRGGNPVVDGVARLRSLFHASTIPIAVHAYDADALERLSAEAAERFGLPMVDAGVVRKGTTFELTASRIGRVVEAAEIRGALAAALATSDPADVRIELTPAAVAPTVTTADARAVAAEARGMVQGLSLEIPGAAEDEAPIAVSAGTIAEWISFGPSDEAAYALLLDQEAMTAEVAAMSETVDRDPLNARFDVAGSGLGGIVDGQDGRVLDVEATTSALMGVLDRRAGGSPVATLAMAVDVTEPALTTAEAEAALPQMRMISSWTTYYVPGDGNGFGNNINIPARDIDGRNLAPGETFSFWGSIGPVTVERGFQYGGVIIGGRSVAGGAIGGGICSTSTTIFNTALRAGLEMGERANHYYYIDRYPDGLDATVYMDPNFTQDMTFRNDTDNPIVIRGFGGNGFVTFQMWSIPTGRTVVITDPVTSNHRAAIETTQLDTSMAPGTARRVEYPHAGHDVSRTRFVYDADGNEIHRNAYFSSYRTVNGITAVGPAPAPPPPADDDEDEEAETAATGDTPTP